MLTAIQVDAALVVQQVTGCTSAQARDAVLSLAHNRVLADVKDPPTEPWAAPALMDREDTDYWSKVYTEHDLVQVKLQCSMETAIRVMYQLHIKGFFFRPKYKIHNVITGRISSKQNIN